MIYFDKDYWPVYLAAIERAQRHIDILMYVWRQSKGEPTDPLTQIMSALLRAKRRGVRVRIITDFEGSMKMLRELGLDAIHLGAARTMHAKMTVIDENIVFIGSHNMTRRSLGNNYEISVMLDDEEQALQARGYFGLMWDYYASSSAV